MESKNGIAVLKIQSENLIDNWITSENDNKGKEHGGESWENFEEKYVEIDSHNFVNPLLLAEEPHCDLSSEVHARQYFDSESDSKEEQIPEHKTKAETKLTVKDNFNKAIKAFESYSSSCCEVQRVEQNRIGEIVRTLKEIKMSQLNIAESSAVPIGITVDEDASSTEESVIFRNMSIKERSIFNSSEIEEFSEFSDESSSLLISPADHEYWGTYEGLTNASYSSSISLSVYSKGANKLIRTSYDQHHSDVVFYDPFSPEFDLNIGAANNKSCFKVKEMKNMIVEKVKSLGKKKLRDPMNMMLDADELRRKLEEHLENERRKLDKLQRKEKYSNWKLLIGCCKQDDVVSSYKRSTSSKSS